MDVLDRLTDRGALERSFEQQQSKLTVIDAAALADRLRAKVVGQSEVIDAIARSCDAALRRGGWTSRSPCSASPAPPGVGKTHFAKYSPRNSMASAAICISSI